IKVLGPDINESQKGFAVNRNKEIRFGLGGLKGVGDAAIENILEEKSKHGSYQNIFDFIKRLNQRSVNKKSFESLAYSGAFDCFKDIHRAQYFYSPVNDKRNGIERIIAFGNQYQTNKELSRNSLFGDSVMPEIASPRLPFCEPWTLTELLDYEKEVTGMFMSGHPLDHFKFELKYYGIMKLIDFNEAKESKTFITANAGKNLRIAGLVINAQHRITKAGKNFASLIIEDFSGKAELMFWSDEYVKFQNYLEKGKNLLLSGFFKQRYNSEEYEFKVTSVTLLETAKQMLTKSVELKLDAQSVTKEMVDFIDRNVRHNPGNSSLKFKIKEPNENLEICLYTSGKGFSMNEEIAEFLIDNPDVEVNVGLVNV
ncbi:MAG: OB-fold nucleic acid binding domain-containing protein, partial [Parafilimonas sp.]